jgi:hypothetical protein
MKKLLKKLPIISSDSDVVCGESDSKCTTIIGIIVPKIIKNLYIIVLRHHQVEEQEESWRRKNTSRYGVSRIDASP